MPGTPARMFTRVPVLTGDARPRHRIVAVPLIGALLDQPSRYSTSDPRTPPPPAPSPVIPRRGARGPTVATITRLWNESNGDRAELRRKLEQRLRRAGLIRQRAATEAEIERLLGPGSIDAPLPD
jgi:hypothetical protein